jgi:uncharacterized membrane protein
MPGMARRSSGTERPVDRSLLNATVVGACALVWLIALAVGIRRVRHRRDRRGLILAVLALMGLLIVAVVYTGTELGAGVTARYASGRRAHRPR